MPPVLAIAELTMPGMIAAPQKHARDVVDTVHPAAELEGIEYTLVLPPDDWITVVRLPGLATVRDALIAGQRFVPEIDVEGWCIKMAEEIELFDLDAPLDPTERSRDPWFARRPEADRKPQPQPESNSAPPPELQPLEPHQASEPEPIQESELEL
jgi:hypothetical protein